MSLPCPGVANWGKKRWKQKKPSAESGCCTIEILDILNKYHLSSESDDFEATCHRFSEKPRRYMSHRIHGTGMFNYTFG